MCAEDCTHTTTTLGDDFALYADESMEWARLTLPTALESWPKWDA